jgi:hypothetical protein
VCSTFDHPKLLRGFRFCDLFVADRLFSSLARCWSSVLKNHSDVKELIPEFYGGGWTGKSARFLLNEESLDLGAF